MSHIDPDDLAVIALAGVELSDAALQHLTECPKCELELISLQHTVAVGKSAASVSLNEPADEVWKRIHKALGLSAAVADPPRPSQFAPPKPAPDAPDPTHAQVSTGPLGAAPAAPIELARRRRWLPVAIAAASIGLVAGLGGGLWLGSLRQVPSPKVVDQAQLAPFPGWRASGHALVNETTDGHRNITIDLTGLTTQRGTIHEVWLIKADSSGLISIGLLEGNIGHFTIPDSINLAEYPLVDVSAQLNNGNPAHSGNSIVRGNLHSST
jgi:hypothetical protein